MTSLPVPLQTIAPRGKSVNASDAASLIGEAFRGADYRGKRVLLIIPDATRTCPVGQMFQHLHGAIGGEVAKLDVIIALGTHQPMSEDAICERLEISMEQRRSTYRDVAFINHEWDNPAKLRRLGTISSDEIRALSDGLFAMEVPVEISSTVFDYD